MKSDRRIGRRRLAAFVALWAIWLHALLPPGFMPGATASGAAGILICSGGLPAHLTVNLDNSGGDAADRAHGDAACVFAAQAALDPAGPAARPAWIVATAPARPPAYLGPVNEAPAPALGPRAPPLSARA